MYQDYYKFTSPAFGLPPDHRFYFPSRSHARAMAYLRYGLQQGEGFVVITGEVGAGKSTLVAQLFAELDSREVLAGQIATTNIDADDAIRLIVSAFKIVPPAADKASHIRAFEGFLLDQHKAGRRVLLVVDEAQHLPYRTIEELRMLSNFAVGGRALFQCFLLGQPQFRATLADPALEQLRQRVIASHHLEPMTMAETRGYIEHRLTQVGWNNCPTITDRVFELIHQHAGGIARRINLVSSRLLLFGALEERDYLDEAALENVIADLELEMVESVAASGTTKSGSAATINLSVGMAAAADHAHHMEQMNIMLANHDRALRDVLLTLNGLLTAVADSGSANADQGRR